MRSDLALNRGLRDYDRIIMGIDPGTNLMGYAMLGIKGRNPSLIVMGVLITCFAAL